MPESVAFVQPQSIEQAIACLERYGGDAKVVAGATALTIMLRQRLIHPKALVSIGGLPGLDSIEALDRQVHIGALATHRAVELSPAVRQAIPVLSHVFGVAANVRVRNAATVGGVLAEADYASDPPAVLLALNGEVEAIGPNGARTIPAKDFFVGFYETVLEASEIVTGVRVPSLDAGTYAVYEKYVTRSKEDRPCLGAVAAVRMSADGKTCEDLRVAVGAVAEAPQRFADVEALARETDLGEDVARTIADGYAERVDTWPICVGRPGIGPK